jgi:hypothetical protein
MDQGAWNRLFAKAGAPVTYLAERSIDLRIVALREHLAQGDLGTSPRPILLNGHLFTLHSGNLVELTHAELLGAITDALGNHADRLVVSRTHQADGRVELELVSSEKALEIRPGDVVTAGLHIEHSRYGEQATQIQTFVYRLICANGMMRRECVATQGIVRTRKLPVHHPQAKELLLDQVRRLTARTWGGLEPQLLELQATSARRADVPALLRQWAQRARVSIRTTDTGRTIMDRLLNAWRTEGQEDTYYAAVNAFTRVASHDAELSQRQRRVLSLLGGLLAFSGAHICPHCFSVLSDSMGASGLAANWDRSEAPPRTQPEHAEELTPGFIEALPPPSGA